MQFIGDFHIHSHFSIATSKQLVPEHLDHWAGIKGIRVIGTGDFTHPGWLSELRGKIEPAESGLFRLKKEYRTAKPEPPGRPEREIRFLLTAEISSIYKKKGKVRKVHNVIFAPDFETVEKIARRLGQIGNITSDGRPILGLDSHDLLEIALNASPDVLFVPAHIWTPWFSALGDKSGFDSIEECFDDLAGHIHVVETGLSSDPPMNWLCSSLDRYTLISNSDAHSPDKLGRNANWFDTDLSYAHITNALKTANPGNALGTIDLYPQEGKYHYDGHRKCGVCWHPSETLRNEGICPVCGKKVTIGVLNRVMQLADREKSTQHAKRLPCRHIIPLREILSEMLRCGAAGKKVGRAYDDLIRKAGSEFDILLHLPVDEVRKLGDETLGEAIRRMRAGEVIITEGYDGEYGNIRVFAEHERDRFSAQASLFDTAVAEKRVPCKPLTRKKTAKPAAAATVRPTKKREPVNDAG